jgi:hypothetical protein
MSRARQLLIAGGIVLALWGMAYGLWYAAFAEHQDLDRIGSSLVTAFSHTAERNPAAAASALAQYQQTKFAYDRRVDVHGHWIGLAMLLILLGICFDRVALSERWKSLLAAGLFLGSAIFPLGVLLQTFHHGAPPRFIAALGSALVILSMSGISWGLIRKTSFNS